MGLESRMERSFLYQFQGQKSHQLISRLQEILVIVTASLEGQTRLDLGLQHNSKKQKTEECN